jgi:hypothetical protein
MDGWIDKGSTEELNGEWIHGRIDGQTGGWIRNRMDRWMGGG